MKKRKPIKLGIFNLRQYHFHFSFFSERCEISHDMVLILDEVVVHLNVGKTNQYY